MANGSDEVVKVGIESEITGGNEIDALVAALNNLEPSGKKGAGGVSKVEASFKRTSKAAGEAGKVIDQYTIKVRQKNQTEAQAEQSSKRAENAAIRSANAQKRVAVESDRVANSRRRASLEANRLSVAESKLAVDTQKVELAQRKAADATDRFNKKIAEQNAIARKSNLQNLQRNADQVGSGLRSAGAAGALAVTAPIAAVSGLAVKQAIEVDAYKTKLIAFTGSVQAAEAKLIDLRKLSRESVGVLTKDAIDTYSQLAGIGGISEKVIDQVIKSSGKLKGAFNIDDLAQYNRNIVQIFSQNFEKQDIKEAIGRVPIFNQLLDQAFGTSDPEQLRKLRASGKITLDSFVEGLANAALNDTRLAGLGDNLGTKLAKATDEILFSLVPLGNKILDVFLPLVPMIVSFIDALSRGFSALSPFMQTVVIAIGGIAAIIPPVLIALGAMIGGISGIITFGGALVSILTTIGGAFVSLGGFIVSFIGLIGQAGLIASFSALASVLGGALLTAITGFLIAAAKVVLAIVAIAAVVAVIVIAVAAAAKLIYEVWNRNIGGIRDQTIKAFTAIRDFLLRVMAEIKAIYDRVMPQISALQEKTLAAIGAFWATHGEFITNTISVAWEVIKTVIQTGVRVIGAMIEFVLAVMNGDWAKAWESASRIVYEVINAIVKLFLNFQEISARIFIAIIYGLIKILYEANKYFLEGAINIGKAIIQGIKDTIAGGAPAIASALATLAFSMSLPGILFGFYQSGKNAADSYNQGVQNNLNSINNAINPPSVDAPKIDAPKMPAIKTPSFAGGAGKAKKAKAAFRPSPDPIDKADNAEIERDLNKAKDQNERLQRENQRNYDLEIIAFSDYLGRRKSLQEAAFGLEIDALDAQGKKIVGNIQKLESRQLTVKPNTSEAERVARELDQQYAELIKIDTDITLLKRKREDVRSETEFDATKALIESEKQAEETRQKYLELSDAKREAASIGFNLEFDEKLKKLAVDLAAAETARANALAAGANDDVLLYDITIKRLKTILDQTNAIREQSELNADFVEIQETLQKLDDERSQALQRLENRLRATGVSEDEATKQRRALMVSYESRIDAVIAKLQSLQAQGARNPEIQKTIDQLNIGKENDALIPFEEKVQEFEKRFNKLIEERNKKLTDLDNNSAFTDLEKDIERNNIQDQYNLKLNETLALWKAIEETRAGGSGEVSESFKSARAEVDQSKKSVVDFGASLRGVAQTAGLDSILNFFGDVASGAKSFKDAALDALGSFVQAIQKVIITILALYAISAVTGIPVSVLAKFLGGGLKDGGAVSSVPVRGLASGGGVLEIQKTPSGLIRGAGSSRSDSILTYFPEANRAARVSRTEYVLDAETTSNIGVSRLDRIRAMKGRGIEAMFLDRLNARGLAQGGAVAVDSSAQSAGISAQDAPELKAGDVAFTANQLNVIERAPIEEIISEHFAGAAGDKIFVNLMNRNQSKLKQTVKS
jgi:hypothetical protein